MARDEPIIALFDDRAQALRLRDELRAAGMPEPAMTTIEPASDRADVVGMLLDIGIGHSDAALFADEVCGGATLLALCPTKTEHARVAEIIAGHAPMRPGRPQAVTETIPGDASSRRTPEITSMPTGSGSVGSRPNPAEDDEQ